MLTEENSFKDSIDGIFFVESHVESIKKEVTRKRGRELLKAINNFPSDGVLLTVSHNKF